MYTCSLFQWFWTVSLVEQKTLICCWQLILGCNTPVFQSVYCFIGPCISNYPHGLSRNLQCKLWYIGSWWTNNKPGQWKYRKSEYCISRVSIMWSVMHELNEVLFLFFVFIVILIRAMPCHVLLFHLIFSQVFQNFCLPVTCMLFVSLFCCFSLFLHLMSSLIISHKFGGKIALISFMN